MSIISIILGAVKHYKLTAGILLAVVIAGILGYTMYILSSRANTILEQDQEIQRLKKNIATNNINCSYRLFESGNIVYRKDTNALIQNGLESGFIYTPEIPTEIQTDSKAKKSRKLKPGRYSL